MMSAPWLAASTMFAFILARVAALSPHTGVKLTQAMLTTGAVPLVVSFIGPLLVPAVQRYPIEYGGTGVNDLDPLAETAERLAHDHGLEAELEQRTLRLPAPVK